MNFMFRRVLIGFLAGVLAGLALAITLPHPLLVILLGGLVGASGSASLKPTRGTYVDNLMAGGALGIPLWGLVSVIVAPLLSGRMPEWNAEQMRSQFPALVGWMIYGTLLGLLTQGLNDLVEIVWGPEVDSAPPAERKKTRVVILGGGFAGMHTAECLEEVRKAVPGKDPLAVVKERFEYEFGILTSKGMSDYMLIVYDFIAWAKRSTAALMLVLFASILQMAARTYNPFIYFRF